VELSAAISRGVVDAVAVGIHVTTALRKAPALVLRDSLAGRVAKNAGTEGIWNKDRVERVYVLKAPL
jgi:hypothetical protein